MESWMVSSLIAILGVVGIFVTMEDKIDSSVKTVVILDYKVIMKCFGAALFKRL